LHAVGATLFLTAHCVRPSELRIHAIAVANNSYDQGWGKLFTRSCLDRGSLTLYILRRLTLTDALRLWVEMAMGRWQEDDALVIESVRSVSLRAKRAAISVMIDGEVATLQAPLDFRIRQKAVRVLVPKVRAEAVPACSRCSTPCPPGAHGLWATARR